MNSDEFYEYEDRAYLKPTLSSGEQEAFINNLRDIQSQNNQQITTDTYNLGTAVPSNLGGLGGGEAYFNSRYQTPQVNELVDTLKSAAQAQALTDVMSNYQDQLKQRYNAAYRNAQKRQRSAYSRYGGYGGYGGTGGTGGTGDGNKGWNGDIETESTDGNNGSGNWIDKSIDFIKSHQGDLPSDTKWLVDNGIYKKLPAGWKYMAKKMNGETMYGGRL